MRKRSKGFSSYEGSLIAVAVLIGAGAGFVVSERTGGGVGRGLAIGFAVIILLSFYPAGGEVTRETPAGLGWKDLEDPYRSRFRALVVRHLASCWAYAALCVGVVGFLSMDRLDLGIALILLGGFTLALLVASVLIRRRLRAVWAQVESDPSSWVRAPDDDRLPSQRTRHRPRPGAGGGSS